MKGFVCAAVAFVSVITSASAQFTKVVTDPTGVDAYFNSIDSLHEYGGVSISGMGSTTGILVRFLS